MTNGSAALQGAGYLLLAIGFGLGLESASYEHRNLAIPGISVAASGVGIIMAGEIKDQKEFEKENHIVKPRGQAKENPPPNQHPYTLEFK